MGGDARVACPGGSEARAGLRRDLDDAGLARPASWHRVGGVLAEVLGRGLRTSFQSPDHQPSDHSQDDRDHCGGDQFFPDRRHEGRFLGDLLWRIEHVFRKKEKEPRVEVTTVSRWFLSAVPPSPVGPLGESGGAGSGRADPDRVSSAVSDQGERRTHVVGPDIRPQPSSTTLP